MLYKRPLIMIYKDCAALCSTGPVYYVTLYYVYKYSVARLWHFVDQVLVKVTHISLFYWIIINSKRKICKWTKLIRTIWIRTIAWRAFAWHAAWFAFGAFGLCELSLGLGRSFNCDLPDWDLRKYFFKSYTHTVAVIRLTSGRGQCHDLLTYLS